MLFCHPRSKGQSLKSAAFLFLLITLLAAFVQPTAAQSNPAAQVLSRINALRVQNGLIPLALNDALDTAAQAHSNDMAATGNVDHAGSD